MRLRAGAFVLLSLLVAPQAWGADFVIQPGLETNQVVFRSEAPVESFEGKTRKVRSEIRVDLDALDEDFEVKIEVDLASLETGMALRDKHMRENHLETDRFPIVSFHGTELLEPSQPAIGVGEQVRFRVRGDLDLHGVTRVIEVPIEADRLDSDRILIRAAFPVRLSDHRIERPKFLFMKLSEEQQIRVEAVATALAATKEGE